MNPSVLSRVLKAVVLIETANMGVDRAARQSGTDRRTIYKYLKSIGKEIVRTGTGKDFQITIRDLPQPKGAVLARVKKAIALMERRGIGVDSAARMVGTDRRTIYKYLTQQGIKTVRQGKTRKVVIQRSATQKKIDFVWAMSKGKSATEAAKELNTTVKTMAKVKEKGQPIIKKVKRKWVAQFLPVFNHRLVVYGTLTGFNRKTLGRNKVSPNKATEKNLDKEYAEIWWQIDFNNFKSTLDALDVGQCHAPLIYLMLKTRLETPSLSNPTLVGSFNTDPRIQQDILTQNRGTTPANTLVSPLENLFQKYDLRFDDDYNWGVDDNMGARPVELLSIKSAQTKYFQPVGKFQILVLRQGYAEYYPDTPLKIHYRVSVKNEDECRKKL
jgi:ACT domain-containing protein